MFNSVACTQVYFLCLLVHVTEFQVYLYYMGLQIYFSRTVFGYVLVLHNIFIIDTSKIFQVEHVFYYNLV